MQSPFFYQTDTEFQKKNQFFKIKIIFGAVISILLFGGGIFAQSTPNQPTSAQSIQKKDFEKIKSPAEKSSQKSEAGKTESVEKKSSAGNRDISYGFKEPKAEDMPSAAWLLVKTFGILAIFIAGFLLLFRFVSKRSKSQLIGTNLIQVIANVPIANQRFLQVVDIAGGIYILGVTDNNINLITQITDPQILAKIQVEASAILQKRENLTFYELIQKLTNGEIFKPANSLIEKDDKNIDDYANRRTRNKINNIADEESNLQGSRQNGIVSEFMERHRQRLNELKQKNSVKGGNG